MDMSVEGKDHCGGLGLYSYVLYSHRLCSYDLYSYGLQQRPVWRQDSSAAQLYNAPLLCHRYSDRTLLIIVFICDRYSDRTATSTVLVPVDICVDNCHWPGVCFFTKGHGPGVCFDRGSWARRLF